MLFSLWLNVFSYASASFPAFFISSLQSENLLFITVLMPLLHAQYTISNFKKHIANYKNHNFFIIPSSYLVYFIQLNILSIIGHILFVIHFQCDYVIFKYMNV